jgi:uncharacterized protein YbbK (DUF523 family)
MVDASQTILVSACLLGLKTRYNGETRSNSAVLDLLQTKGWTPVPVCPEQLGGLPTPRPKAEFVSGDGMTLIEGQGQLINDLGVDVSSEFLLGAEQAANIATLSRCTIALLKERSPSCGVHSIYRNGELTAGTGVAAACLKKAGIQVFSEENIVDGHLIKKEV